MTGTHSNATPRQAEALRTINFFRLDFWNKVYYIQMDALSLRQRRGKPMDNDLPASFSSPGAGNGDTIYH